MNTLAKTLVIGTALFATAGAAVAIAGPGMGNFGNHSGMMQGMSGPAAGMGMGQGMGRGMGQGAGMMGGPGAMLDRIPNLTAEQREQLTQLQAEQHAAMQGMRTAMMSQRGNMDAQSMQDFRSAMLEQRDSIKAKLDTILSDEQKAALPIFQH